MNSCRSIEFVGVHAAVDHVHHRHGQRRRARRRRDSGRATARHPPRRPSRPRARRRESRSRRGAPCSACRRARSAPVERLLVGRVEPDDGVGDLAVRRSRPPASRPCRRRRSPPSRSSTASCTPVDAPEGTAARPTAPDSSSTSTSTVGLPRESRIWRAWTWAIALIRWSPWQVEVAVLLLERQRAPILAARARERSASSTRRGSAAPRGAARARDRRRACARR